MFEPNDIDDMSEKMKESINKGTMDINYSYYMGEYSIQKSIENYLKLYNEITA